MARSKRRIKVFISYSRKDENFARLLRETLESFAEVVVLGPTAEIARSDKVADKISRMLRESDVVIALLSPDSVANPNVIFEIGIAVGLGKKVIPVAKRGADISLIPFNIRDRKVVMSTGPKSTARRIAEDILRMTGPSEQTGAS
jgi:nucleoside 2-deoxyribosyltransferase